MNIVRRLLSSSGSTDSQNEVENDRVNLARQESTIKTPEQELLGLSHLKKLHHEYGKCELSDKEARLYAMLPLFCNVFSSVGHKVISEKFADDIVPFTQSTSRLLVTEVRRRASNQSTEAAAEAIATFMEYDSSGWQLLSTLSLLVGEGDTLTEVRLYQMI